MYLGLDLGTSNSAIVGNSGSDLRLFKTAEGTDVLPSVIYIDKRGHKFIGGRAYDKTIISRENVAEGFQTVDGHQQSDIICRDWHRDVTRRMQRGRHSNAHGAG